MASSGGSGERRWVKGPPASTGPAAAAAGGGGRAVGKFYCVRTTEQ